MAICQEKGLNTYITLRPRQNTWQKKWHNLVVHRLFESFIVRCCDSNHLACFSWNHAWMSMIASDANLGQQKHRARRGAKMIARWHAAMWYEVKKCEDGKHDYGDDADDVDDELKCLWWCWCWWCWFLGYNFCRYYANSDFSCWNSDGWDWSHLVRLLCKYASLPV